MQKVVFITGISSGFGMYIAKQLANKNYIVYGTYRTTPQEKINGVEYIQCDVTIDEQVRNTIDRIYNEQKKIDVVINNAGVGFAGPLECLTIEEAKEQMEVNFFGVIRIVNCILPIMRLQRYGKLIFISSIGGLIGLPYQGLYSASKFALEGYCQSLYNEVKHLGINVILVNPGDFKTKFSQNRRIAQNNDCIKKYVTFANSLRIINDNESKGLHPKILARKIEKIINSSKPKYRYIIASPLQASSLLAKSILPEKVFLSIIRKYYKL